VKSNNATSSFKKPSSDSDKSLGGIKTGRNLNPQKLKITTGKHFRSRKFTEVDGPDDSKQTRRHLSLSIEDKDRENAYFFHHSVGVVPEVISEETETILSTFKEDLSALAVIPRDLRQLGLCRLSSDSLVAKSDKTTTNKGLTSMHGLIAP